MSVSGYRLYRRGEGPACQGSDRWTGFLTYRLREDSFGCTGMMSGAVPIYAVIFLHGYIQCLFGSGYQDFPFRGIGCADVTEWDCAVRSDPEVPIIRRPS